MRIYCQYTIGGYKIFHLTGFDHSYENGKYVTMAEIRDASESDNQDILVSGKCECGLDRKIMKFFSKNSVGMILLHNCGSSQDETFLFIRKPSTKTTFAFAATCKEEIKLLEKIATAWTNGSQEVTEKVLSTCVEEKIIGNEVVFAFNEKSWKDFVADVSNLRTSEIISKAFSHHKNILMNLEVDKRNILLSSGITLPLSSFITIPGNEYVRIKERNNTLIKYGIFLFSVIAIGGFLYYVSKN